MRRALKSSLERVFASSVAARLGRLRRRRQRLILAYHNVIPAGHPARGDRSLHLDFDTFRRQLDWLQGDATVLSLQNALRADSAAPAVAITFDDAYAGAVRLALPELATRGMPATVFVAPGLLDSGVPWWDRVAGEDGAVPEQIRNLGLGEMGGDSAPILAWAAENRAMQPDDPASAIATNADLLTASALPGMTLGAHSWSHANLARQDEKRLLQELEAPLQWLSQRFPTIARPWLAYPYGLSSQLVHELAARSGYEAGFAISGGWFRPHGVEMALPRLNIPARLSLNGFGARVGGLVGI